MSTSCASEGKRFYEKCSVEICLVFFLLPPTIFIETFFLPSQAQQYSLLCLCDFSAVFVFVFIFRWVHPSLYEGVSVPLMDGLSVRVSFSLQICYLRLVQAEKNQNIL